MDQLTIVSVSYLKGLQRQAGMFWLGWLALGIVLIVLIGIMSDMKKEIDLLRFLQTRQSELDKNLENTRLALAKGWESHQEEVKTVIAWGEYIKGREDLSRYNRANDDKLPALTQNLGAKHVR